jgi:PH (Pleckstrin Homology) domain-containing protein/rubredoxin-like zinc ribbon protein
MGNVPRDVVRILGPGEEVQLFIETKIYHPRVNVDSVVLTNERIILRHPYDLSLKKDFTDFSYTDLTPATLDKGLLRSTIKSQLKSTGKPFVLDNLPNADAEKAFGVIQSNIVRYQTPFSTGPGMNPPIGTAQGSLVGVTCQKCGHASRPESKFCDSCGAKLK